jgi:UDP-N-acetyl-D-mannosaminuronic acid dehydrogenase
VTTAGQTGFGVYDADTPDHEVSEGFTSGEWPVAVYGLGKMGLPIASVFAEVTGVVEGVDVDQRVVSEIEQGGCPVDGEPGLDTLVADLVDSGKLSVTTDAESAARRATIHVIIVPTTIRSGNRPDLSALRSVSHAIGRGIEAGNLVLVESTVPPGSSRRVVRQTISKISGLSEEAFGVAFCPERTASGRALEDIRGSYPKIVGGVDEESTRLAELLYDEITSNEVIAVDDAETAECVKLFEGVYRDVNIALANELVVLGEELEVDVRSAIDAANTQPYCDLHTPGPGVGGHCIPYYPWFLTDGLRSQSPLIPTARYVNDRMPAYTARRCLEFIGRRGIEPADSTVLVLGVAYRPEVAEARKSPAIDLAKTLANHDVEVYATDPVLGSFPAMDATVLPIESIYDIEPDLIVVVTPHSAFETIDWAAFEDPLIVDCRDGLDGLNLPHERWVLGSD